METKVKRNDKVFERENKESEDVAWALFNKHVKAKKRVHLMTWKDEGAAGPVWVYLQPVRRGLGGIPFGDKCADCGYSEGLHSRALSTEGSLYLGWMLRGKARQMAKRFNLPYQEQ